jgi:hypothetical protein
MGMKVVKMLDELRWMKCIQLGETDFHRWKELLYNKVA